MPAPICANAPRLPGRPRPGDNFPRCLRLHNFSGLTGLNSPLIWVDQTSRSGDGLEEPMATKTESAARACGPFDEAVANFNDAVKAGVKAQEEIGKWWSDALAQAGGGGEQWQKQSKAVFAEAIPAAQKNAEDWLKLVDQNYKRSLALFKKAWEVQPADAEEMRAKSQE